MLLTFTEISIDGHRKNYLWCFTSMETALDMLSLLTAKGRKVVRAQLIDNRQYIQLSVEAFNENKMDFSGAFQQLELQLHSFLADITQTPV